MSKQYKTEGIILSRTNFGEADRILSFITSDQGKVKAIAKAVRKSKSKLAGGLELFSVSQLSFVSGKGEIDTVISTRLAKHYGNIVKDLKRTEVGYELIRLTDKNTEAAADGPYFELLKNGFAGLDDTDVEISLVRLWFNLQLLKLTGHEPNLRYDDKGAPLADSASYDFKPEGMHFMPRMADDGIYSANHIKFLRLALASSSPQVLNRVRGAGKFAFTTLPLAQSMLKNYLRQ